MKKITALLVFLFFATFSLSAQSYQSAIGLRLGYPSAVSYKFFLNETNAIEMYGGYRSRSVYIYRWTALGVGVTYQIHNDLSDVLDGLTWFYGGGAGVSFYTYSNSDYFADSDDLGVSVHGTIGLDYSFANAPVNLSLDWKPTFSLIGYDNGFGAGFGALSVRYILGE